jgi:hypothetical protein
MIAKKPGEARSLPVILEILNVRALGERRPRELV